MLDRVDRRTKLQPRREPYWQRLTAGRSLGFRRLTADSAGNWIARVYNGQRYEQKPLGDFATLLEKERFDAAKKAAEEWFSHLDAGGSTDAVSVKQACDAYVKHLRIEKGDAAANDAEGRFRRLVYPDPIARVQLSKLAPRHVSDWKERVLAKGGTRGSFNRNATALRRALNLAHDRRDVASNHAWSKELRAFKNADGRRDLYHDRKERRALLKHTSEEAAPFVRSLAFLPFRPGDVAKLKVEHLNLRQRVLSIPTGKTEPRIVPLSAEALAHFKECAKDKLPGAWLVSRADGGQWKKESWRDEIKLAAAGARLPSGTCAYTIRHSVITDLIVGGLDLFTISKISGTSIQMLQNHYGHLLQEHAREALKGLSL